MRPWQSRLQTRRGLDPEESCENELHFPKHSAPQMEGAADVPWIVPYLDGIAIMQPVDILPIPTHPRQ